MTHPLIVQLRFTRRKWREGLAGVSDGDGLKRFMPMNSIGWMVGHLANHERMLWLQLAQGKDDHAETLAMYEPAVTPVLSVVMKTYDDVVRLADPYLDTLTQSEINQPLIQDGKPGRETTGQILLRLIYHYWFHLGEMQSVRQMLGHSDLPGFVGHIDGEIYLPESG